MVEREVYLIIDKAKNASDALASVSIFNDVKNKNYLL